ncbi:MAG: hypothetical protein ACI8RD_003308, partial [Bacillariaceae sp.]
IMVTELPRVNGNKKFLHAQVHRRSGSAKPASDV